MTVMLPTEAEEIAAYQRLEAARAHFQTAKLRSQMAHAELIKAEHALTEAAERWAKVDSGKHPD
jgi:hypothetical protein